MEFILFSGGAAHGLVQSVEQEFTRRCGLTIQGSYGAVGVYRDKYLAGDHADMLILSRQLIDGLARDDQIAAEDIFDIGAVRTAVAVRSADPKPDISTPAAFRTAIAAATDIYFPDPKTATAGIHFARVMRACGIDLERDARLHPHPNGASAMRAMAAQQGGRPIASTQITEILPIVGVATIGMLPGEFELATIYTIGIPRRCKQRNAALTLTDLLTGDFAKDLRPKAGFGI